VLADEPVHPVTVEPLGAGEIRPAAPPTVPADIAGRVRGTYVGRPGLVALRLLRHDGHPCQLVLPLLAGRVTIAGIGTGDRHPSIELLLAPNPLRRRHRASQKRILWAQRFFKVEGRSDVLALVKGLDDEPLAVALAGYAALGTQDPGQALEHALRLQAETPDLHDGHILLAAAQHMLGRSPMDPTAGSRVPVMLAGLQSQVSTGREPSPSPSLALRLLSRAVLSQIWLLLDGDGDVRQDDVTSGPLRS
jgi:hypothetical protein